MKKVLVVSYYFPPAGGVSVQRVLKLVKYLPLYGWQPVVVTAREKDYVLTDDSLVSQVPAGTPVYRAPAPDLYGWYRISGRKAGAPPDLSAIAVREEAPATGLQKFGLFVRSAFFIPDARVAWLPSVLRTGAGAMRKEGVSAILTSSPPFTTALAGGLLSMRSGLPWISDYRDPWTQAYFYFPRPALSRKIEDGLEAWLLRRAKAVTAINGPILDGLAKKYGSWDRGRGVEIASGYDPGEFTGLRPVRGKKFTIVYTGTLHVQMSPEPLLRAVETLASSEPGFREDVRLSFFGRVASEVEGLFEKKEIAPLVELHPHVPHREALGRMLGADLLLLIVPVFDGNAMITSGKIYEYLRAGRPVLCLSDESHAARIIRETGAGFVIPPSDPGALLEGLRAWYRRWKRKEPLLAPVDRDTVERYDFRHSAREFASLLDRLTEKRRNSG